MQTQRNGEKPGMTAGAKRTILHLHPDAMDGICWNAEAKQLSIYNTLDDEAAPAGAFIQGVINLDAEDLIGLGSQLIQLGREMGGL